MDITARYAAPAAFDLHEVIDALGAPRWLRRLAPAAEHLLGLTDLNALYARTGGTQHSPAQFAARVLRELDVRIENLDTQLSRVPAKGPLLIVANHPFGLLDGLALIALLQKVRPDLKVMTNHLLGRISELRPTCLLVDVMGSAGAAPRNLTPLRTAAQWLRGGGALAVFPAGEVAHASWSAPTVSEAAWSQTVGWLARRSGATVLPVYFAGRNSSLFQLLGLVHPRLRTAMLPRQLMNKRGAHLRAEIGTPIPAARLSGVGNDQRVANYLRSRTLLLAARGKRTTVPRALSPSLGRPIAAPGDPRLIEAQIHAIPQDQWLAAGGDLAVFFGRYEQMPAVMHEVGRLREITFREVGEGTGQPLDLDRFDQHYTHLLLWDRAARQIVGGYRMALTDQVVAAHGIAGLYTHKLFGYSTRLLQQMGPAIELGRSFVRSERQREYAPLMLLWRGIAQFVARHPDHVRLFGPVSISNDYHSLTRSLLIKFLKAARMAPDLAAHVRPPHPPRMKHRGRMDADLSAVVVDDLAEVDDLVCDIESDRRGMPVLLRQYLRLNARVLGFNVDPAFGDALDALMLVDLRKADRAILVRYLGRETAAALLAHHGRSL